MKYIACPSCNEDNPDTRVTCFRCGCPLSAPPRPAPAKPPRKTVFNDRWRAFWVLSPVAMLVIGFLFSAMTNDGQFFFLGIYIWVGVVTAVLWVRRINASEWKFRPTALRILRSFLVVLSLLAWPFLILPALLPAMGMLAKAGDRPSTPIVTHPTRIAEKAPQKPTGLPVKLAAPTVSVKQPQHPAVTPAPSATKLIAEIIGANTIIIGSEIKQQERIDSLVAMGVQVIPEIDRAIRRFLAVQESRAVSQFENVGLLCEALGKIGGKDAQQKLSYYANLHSNVYEYRYIREAAERGLKNFDRAVPPAAPIQPVQASVSRPVGSKPQKAETHTLQLAEGVDMVFVKVPAGKFFMGTDKAKDFAYEEKYAQYPEPPHEVTLEDYWIGKYPITYRQYWAYAPELCPSATDEVQRLENLPITLQFFKPGGAGMHNVNIDKYCHWLSEKTGRVIRIPSDEEWEKAARGTDGRIWPWGNNPPTQSLCNFSDCGIRKSTPVGKYSPQGDSPYGCVDIAGNVFEMTNTGMLRGGYHSFARNMIRCASYWRGVTSETGFRLVMQ